MGGEGAPEIGWREEKGGKKTSARVGKCASVYDFLFRLRLLRPISAGLSSIK